MIGQPLPLSLQNKTSSAGSVHGFLQARSRSEACHLAGLDLDALAGARIDAFARLALNTLE